MAAPANAQNNGQGQIPIVRRGRPRLILNVPPPPPLPLQQPAGPQMNAPPLLPVVNQLQHNEQAAHANQLVQLQ